MNGIEKEKNKVGALSSRLPTPREIFTELPVPAVTGAAVQSWRQDITDVITGKSKKLLVVVGPCSIHDERAALEYAGLLKAVQEEFQAQLLLVMRTYFEKPRTSVGWKGLISDPHLNETYDIEGGLRLARKILLAINALGVPTATEFLEIITVSYLCDLVSWGAIGARTVESQLHRELASLLPLPIGFKNSTAGDVMLAVEAICAARGVHNFLSINEDGCAAVFETVGNNFCHLVLRGGKEQTNYDKGSVNKAAVLLKKNGLLPRVVIDCSHGNSRKQYTRQAVVLNDVIKQLVNGSRVIAGVMLESHLLGGKQQFVAGQKPDYNCSITDACVSWDETYDLLSRLAKTRR